MAELWQLLLQLVAVIGLIGWQVLVLVGPWLLLIVWVAWWLWAVDWRRLWPTLAEGAWAPLALLAAAAAGAWAMILPSTYVVPGWGLHVGNFWWQLAAVGGLIGVALFCGWLQLHYRWSPQEIPIEPPAAAHHGEHHPGEHHHAGHRS